jgi:hypothetical protein
MKPRNEGKRGISGGELRKWKGFEIWEKLRVECDGVSEWGEFGFSVVLLCGRDKWKTATLWFGFWIAAR